jgi:hypothetical protein
MVNVYFGQHMHAIQNIKKPAKMEQQTNPVIFVLCKKERGYSSLEIECRYYNSEHIEQKTYFSLIPSAE